MLSKIGFLRRIVVTTMVASNFFLQNSALAQPFFEPWQSNLVTPYDGNPQDLWTSIGDINGDNIADIVLYHHDGSFVHRYFGFGDGQFSTPTTDPKNPSKEFATTITDLDGDGVTDAIFTSGSYQYNTNFPANKGQVFKNNGVGGYTKKAPVYDGIPVYITANGVTKPYLWRTWYGGGDLRECTPTFDELKGTDLSATVTCTTAMSFTGLLGGWPSGIYQGTGWQNPTPWHAFSVDLNNDGNNHLIIVLSGRNLWL